MNIALQKRHEQLERWRQNEANEEQQQALAAAAAGAKAQEKSPSSSIDQGDDPKRDLKSNAKSKQAVQNNISTQQNELQVPESANKISSTTGTKLRLTTSIGGRQRSSSSVSPTNKTNTVGRQQVSRDDQQQIKKQSRVAQVKFSNSTLFLSACANGDLAECKRLLEAKSVDLNVTTCDGLTGLHEAAICGNAEMAEYLLKSGANIDCCDHEGWTPLHAAASLGQADIVELLLKYKANATIVNCDNFLAYDLARNDEVRELIGHYLEGHDIEKLRHQEELLIEQDIDKWCQTGNYEEKFHPVTRAGVLHVIAAKGYTKLLKRILEMANLRKQIDLEARDSEGFTPLLAASLWNQTEVVELLIEYGANIFAQSDSGYKISSFQLKNYQQKKSNQPQPMRPSIKAIRSSSQSIDSDNASLENSENYSRATSRSATSLDSTASTATGNDGYDDSSIGDNIPSGSARHLRQQQQHQTSCLSKSKSLDISNKGSDGSNEVSMLFSTMSVDRLLLRADSMGERDLRKSFKELVMENERLKQQLKGLDDTNKQRHQEWIRKERQLQRKVSELEEENKEIEHWKQEIQRLKDENNSLIRVVSKLSKQR